MSTDLSCPLISRGICVKQDGTLAPCCEYLSARDTPKKTFTEYQQWRSVDMKQIAEELEQGHEHSGCRKCFFEERHGHESRRLRAIRMFGNSKFDDSAPIEDAEIRFGNYCNLKCIMCHSGASSQVATERITHRDRFRAIGIYEDVKMEKWWETPEFDQFYADRLSQLRIVNFTGGEPMLIPKVARILDNIDRDRGPEVMFNTNMTRLPDDVLELLKSVPRVFLMVSLEGIGAANDYLRYPSQWSVIESNISRARQALPHAEIGVNHTLQHASVYSLPDLAAYCHANGLYLHLTPVQGTDRLKLESVLPDRLQEFKLWVSQDSTLSLQNREFLLNILSNTVFDPDLHQSYRQYVELLDSIRGTNYRETFKVDL